MEPEHRAEVAQLEQGAQVNQAVNQGIVNEPIRVVKTALDGFVKQFRVDGRDGIDAATFIDEVRPIVVDAISLKRQTKVQLVLTCEMERVDTITGEITTCDPSPHLRSFQEVIL